MTERGQAAAHGTFQFTRLYTKDTDPGLRTAWLFRSYSLRGGILTGERKGLAFLRSHSSKGQECYTYFYNDRNEAEQGGHLTFPEAHYLSKKIGENKAQNSSGKENRRP